MNARHLSLGTFKNNVAHSNGHSGLLAYHFEQSSHITFENFQSYKNYYYGFYVYYGFRFILDRCFFAENKGGIFLRHAYDVQITDVDIRGLSDQILSLPTLMVPLIHLGKQALVSLLHQLSSSLRCCKSDEMEEFINNVLFWFNFFSLIESTLSSFFPSSLSIGVVLSIRARCDVPIL